MGAPSSVVVGEALVDVVHRAGEDASAEHPGGSPLNVAYGLGRLGHDVALLTRLGDDAHGRLLREHLAAGSVRLLPGAVDGEATSTARAEVDAEGKATYEFDLVWRLPDTPLPEGVALVHTGSIGAAVAPGADSALELLRSVRGRATTSYDPNVRPAFFDSPAQALARVEEFVEAADVVKASDEDLDWLLPGEDVEAVARRWQARGPALVVVTRGSAGAVAVCGAATLHVPAPAVDVVDTVGAGDAFMSGLLHALAEHGLLGGAALPRLRHLDLRTCEDLVTTAVRSASITCSRAGANPPTRAELAAGG
ncbi:carbohydrate kinase family protein [Kineococcus aurantiacus]|uniref:Fructokinase n=1 Tax=Kineococcus aurantiacus TaxID=37633 RepID=A0A7Y9J273_9ACTN|nr:carbohydrate kinase [Kineococcus aurantiacus]NYD23962.1 fructokinase [Kineococcus aurantiacus]